MRRSPSLFCAQVILGIVAAGAAAGCKTQGPVLVQGSISVYGSPDGGSGTSFDIGQACNGFSTTTTLYLQANGTSVDGVQLSMKPTSTFFTPTQPTSTTITTDTLTPFTVTFNPPSGSNAAPESGTLVIDSVNGSNTPLPIQLTASVANAPANAEIAATCLDSTKDGGQGGACNFLIFSPPFHGVPLNSSGTQIVEVTNNGCPPLDVTAILEDGGDPQYTLSGLTSPIAYHQKVPLTVTFTPTSLSAASNVLSLTGVYPDAGFPYMISLTGAGIAPVLTFNPISWSFPGSIPGQPNCEQFTITNTGSESVMLNPPVIGDVPSGENGVFTIDAGWAPGKTLNPGDTATCVVCVDFSDAGVVYTAELEVGYNQSGSSATSTAALTASASSSLCKSVPEVTLPDDHMFCGFESGSFDIFTCSDGGSCINISDISWSDGGNFEDLGTITGITPTATGPWKLCPESSPITVSFSIHDNGAVRFLTDAIEIDSDATGQPRTLVDIVPITHPVPRENGTPILIPTDAGPPSVGSFIAGYPILFEIEGNDDGGVNFVYQYYYTITGTSTNNKLVVDGPLPHDPATDSYFDAGNNEAPYFVQSAPYFTEIWFTPNVAGSFTVCPIMLEVDAGFGNCGFDAGFPGAGNPLCSSPFEVKF